MGDAVKLAGMETRIQKPDFKDIPGCRIVLKASIDI
jgi:hypothetical protein